MAEWGALPPEINSGRLWGGVGAATMIAGGGAVDVLSGLLFATGAAGLAVNSAQGVSWAGDTGTVAAAAQLPHLAWEPSTGGMLTAAAQLIKAAGAAFEKARMATPTPAEIAFNQSTHVALQQANIPALGMLTPLIVENRTQYFGDYWVRSGANMYSYMAESAATAGALPPPPPPPPSTANAGLPSGPGPMPDGAAKLMSPSGGMQGMSQMLSPMMSSVQSVGQMPSQFMEQFTKLPQEFAQPIMQAGQQLTSMMSGFGGGPGAGSWASMPPMGQGPVAAQFGSAAAGSGGGGFGGGGLGAGLRSPSAWSSTLNASSVSSQTADGTGVSRFAEARAASAPAGGGSGGGGMLAPMARRDEREEAAQRSPAWAAASEILYREPEHVPVVWGDSGALPQRGGEE
ncbi:PPE family protein [Mycobacteroides chelonae]|uniref:PPE family protein n=1 Tax=Mycobacteroides chelonae TaxID=1774 RepID=UPI000991E879|nr:PPE family protein [Mycobacteroides chelonae]